MGIPQEQELDVVKYKQDQQAYNYWFRKQFGGDGDEDSLQKIARLIHKAVEIELTGIQRDYFVAYYFEGMTMAEIADSCGVNKSTVSRTVSRARKRMARVLKYVNPRLMKAFERGDSGQRKNNKQEGA